MRSCCVIPLSAGSWSESIKCLSHGVHTQMWMSPILLMQKPHNCIMVVTSCLQPCSKVVLANLWCFQACYNHLLTRLQQPSNFRIIQFRFLIDILKFRQLFLYNYVTTYNTYIHTCKVLLYIAHCTVKFLHLVLLQT